MKKYIPHTIAFAAGALIASLVFLLIYANKKIDQNGVLVKTETITKIDTIVVEKEKIITEVVTKEGPTEYIYVDVPRDVVIRDTVFIRIPLKKEHYHSVADEVEIWHSGVASSIDRVVNYRRTEVVTNVYRADNRNELSFGLSLDYSDAFRLPFQLSYEYDVVPWLSVGAYAEYEPLQRTFGGGVQANAKIEW
jgi:hypothetical protein